MAGRRGMAGLTGVLAVLGGCGAHGDEVRSPAPPQAPAVAAPEPSPAVPPVRFCDAARARTLAERLRDGDPPARRSALGELSSIVEDLRPQLQQRADRGDREVVRPLAAENGPGGVEARRACVAQHTAPALVAALADPAEDLRARAYAVLEDLGARVLPLLLPVLDGPDREPRRLALALIGRLGRAAEPALPKVYEVLRGDDAELRLVARLILGQIGHASRDPAVLAAELRHDEPGRAIAAGAELRRLGGAAASVVPALREALRAQGTTPAGRQEACRVLEGLGGAARPAVPELCVSARQGTTPELRSAAIRAIAGAGYVDATVLTALAAAVDDPAPEPCEATMAALARLGAPAVSVLAWALTHPRPAVADLAARALENLGAAAAPAEPQLVAALDNPRAFWPAIHALINIGAAAAVTVPPLEAKLRDPVAHQRRGAVVLLGEVGPDAAGVYAAVWACMHDADPAVVAAVPVALARLDPRDDRTERACIDAMARDDHWVRVGGVAGVRLAGAAAVGAVSALVRVARHVHAQERGEPDPATAAIEAIGSAALPELDRIAADTGRPEAERAIARGWAMRLRHG